jgi:hypothetical protein
MKRDKRVPTRESEPLPERVNKRLTAYALAAGAAGVGLLALAEPARADIITVTIPISIPAHSIGILKINGHSELKFFPTITTFGTKTMDILGGFRAFPSLEGAFMLPPLAKGAPIGPRAKFFDFAEVVCSVCQTFGGGTTRGPWGRKSGYLGFEFLSNSKTHFGWAHLKVGTNPFSAYISEFAYDTVPGQSIEAGQTSPIPEPGTLTLLALGAAGLAVLRRRKPSAVSHQGSATD